MKAVPKVNQKIFYVLPPFQKYVASGANPNKPEMDKSSSNHKAASKGQVDLYQSINSFLKLGRMLALVPISGLFSVKNDSVDNLEFSWTSLATVSSLLVIAALGINVIFSFLHLIKGFVLGTGGRNAVEWAFSARVPLIYLAVLLIYIFFLTRARTLLVLFRIWQNVSKELKLTECDTGLFKSVRLFSVAIYVTTIATVIAMRINDFPVFGSTIEIGNNATAATNVSALETYYHRTHNSWTAHFDYNPVLAVILLINDTFAVFAWNYADLLIIIMSRALYFKFKALVSETEKRMELVSSNPNKNVYKLIGITWAEVRQDHLMLCKLLDDFETFLSPLVFLSYSINIFCICLLLQQGLTPQEGFIIGSLSSGCAFVHLIFRTMSVSLVASKINEYAHRISVPIQKCCSSDYCKEVERLERMLGIGTLGLSGLGCFVVTRAFILVVVSVVFTIEIVLLQATSSMGQSSTPTGLTTVMSTVEPIPIFSSTTPFN